MNLLDRFTNSTQFKDYNDFYNNFRLNVPENFNYAYDVVDEYARLTPEKRALVWCDDLGDERIFSFADVKRLSDKAANFFRSRGIGKGDTVLVILQRLGILDDFDGACKTRRDRHPRDAHADGKRHRIPHGKSPR